MGRNSRPELLAPTDIGVMWLARAVLFLDPKIVCVLTTPDNQSKNDPNIPRFLLVVTLGAPVLRMSVRIQDLRAIRMGKTRPARGYRFLSLTLVGPGQIPPRTVGDLDFELKNGTPVATVNVNWTGRPRDLRGRWIPRWDELPIDELV